jgi:hypothetical protein
LVAENISGFSAFRREVRSRDKPDQVQAQPQVGCGLHRANNGSCTDIHFISAMLAGLIEIAASGDTLPTSTPSVPSGHAALRFP